MIEEDQKELCILCNERHESMSLHGVRYIACPMMPKDVIMPRQTIEVFFQGRSMLDQPLIVITE